MAEPSKAIQELEELYRGVPDESVDLTFKYLAEVKQPTTAHRKPGSLEPNGATPPFESLANHGQEGPIRSHRGHHVTKDYGDLRPSQSQRGKNQNYDHAVESRMTRDDGSVISDINMASVYLYQERGRRRRAGIPHSNICTIAATTSTYFVIDACDLEGRVQVCGRVYCRQCVGMGMGKMTEGRKCIDCLGRRFSHRYIERAGQGGCCMRFRYSRMVIQQELRWAEKGPRGIGVILTHPRSPSPQVDDDRTPCSRSPSAYSRFKRAFTLYYNVIHR
ncbi:hypothetical protein NMG60_11014399 [Bertholletia excelsa]